MRISGKKEPLNAFEKSVMGRKRCSEEDEIYSSKHANIFPHAP